MTRKETLDNALKCVCGERQDQYGTPEDNFGRIAKLWTSYLGHEVSSVDVAMMMALLKIARVKTGTATDDSFVDLAGYAACGAELKVDTNKEDAIEKERNDIAKILAENFNLNDETWDASDFEWAACCLQMQGYHKHCKEGRKMSVLEPKFTCPVCNKTYLMERKRR